MSAARDVYEEGALLFDACRVQTDYADNEDILRTLRLRIRVPEQWWGDYLALLGAVRVGERRLLELGKEFGWDGLGDFVSEWFDYSEAAMERAIRTLPAGTVSAVTRHDPYPAIPDGLDVKAEIEVDPDAGVIGVDLRDNADCIPNGLNLTESTSRTAALVGIFNAIGSEVPPNAGSLRRVEVKLRENCVVGIPVHPYSCSAATTNLADRVANVVQRGLAELGDGLGLAEVGGVIPAASAVVSGKNPRTGHSFVNQIFLAVTGGAGTPWTDAWLTTFHAGGAGMLRRDAVEIAELTHPILIEQQRLLPDTEGAGRFRGAPSAYVEYGPRGTTLVVAYGTDGAKNPALGARGGLPGGPSRHYRRKVDGELVELPSYGLFELADGERVVSITAGGGGYGPPADRDPEAIRRDIEEGWITPGRARDVYGVEI
jgi:N-methylhydantoinase B